LESYLLKANHKKYTGEKLILKTKVRNGCHFISRKHRYSQAGSAKGIPREQIIVSLTLFLLLPNLVLGCIAVMAQLQ